MIKEIVFTSSYSSQLGVLISLSKYFNKLDLGKHSRNIIIFHVSSKGDNSCGYSCFPDKAKNILGKNFNFKIIKINNVFKRLILLFYLYYLKILGLQNNLSIWEPSPFWLKRLFYFKKINLNLFNNYFQDIKYYGDGFLCLSEKSIPFWLENDKLKKENYSKAGIFYYFYNLNNTKNLDNKYIEINSSYIKTIFNKLTSNLRIILDHNYQDLTIFPLTTFSETNRSSLDSEINLYIEYINSKIINKNTPILIKPHPGNLEIKNKLLISKLEAKKFNVINKNFKDISITDLPFNVIPLELLCLILVKKLNISFKGITIALNSNATLSTCYLFPDINHINPFGERLISKYIRKEFIQQRLLQEEILVKKIYQKNNS